MSKDENTNRLREMLSTWEWVDNIRKGRPQTSEQSYALAGLRKECEAVAAAPKGGLHHQLASSSWSVGQVVHNMPGGREQAIEELYEAARKGGAVDLEHARKTIVGQLNEGAKKPRNAPSKSVSPEANGVHAPEQERPTSSPPPSSESGFGEPIPASQLKASTTPTWLWKGYLSRGGVTLYSALWKAGKTTLLAHMLKAMEVGGEFCGQPLDAAKVLYVTEESESRWADRRDVLQLRDHCEFLIRPFKAKPRWEQWQAFLDYLRGLVGARDYNLIAFDTLANLWPVRDENDASQVQAALMPLHQMAEKAALLLVHHNRKGDGTEATASRGSGALTAFVDTIIELRRFNQEDRTDRRRVLTGYGRYDETPAEVVVELTLEGIYNCHGERAQNKADDLATVLLGLMPAGPPGMTFDELVRAWPGDRTPRRKTIFQVLTEGAETGTWLRTGDGIRGNPHRYFKDSVSVPDSVPDAGTDTESSMTSAGN